MTAGGTETALDGAVSPASAATAPYLFVVLEAARPTAGGLRLRLDELDEVVLGRGDERAVTTSTDGVRRILDLRIPDRRMSSVHARVARTLAGWELIDASSKNGTRLEGTLVGRAALADGMQIEVGRTVLRFRAALPASGPAVVASAELTPVAGVVTLLPGLAARLDELARLAASRVSIVLSGETGTGKEVVARALHAASGRTGPLIAVNCAALPAGLVESELFGHRRGAFSGALDDRPGLVRAADGGTLLLDEVGDLPLAAQAALLRVLQEREVVPVGETRPVAVDLRVIAASHRDLPALVEGGELRADLWARLAGHAITLPPLRERREDVGVLVAALLPRHVGARAAGVSFTADAAARLVSGDWPLNVRALDKALETALALAGSGPIGVEHLRRPRTDPPLDVTPQVVPIGDDELRARLLALLIEHRGNITQIARALGKARMQIQRWLKRFDLDPERFRS